MAKLTRSEIKICHSAIIILSEMCAGSPRKIIDCLTEYLWDQEEAGVIKKYNKSLKVD